MSNASTTPVEQLVGRTYAPFTVTVDAAKVREFAEALGDRGLAAEARSAIGDPHASVVAPLTFARNFWWEGSEVHDDLGFDWPRVVHGSQEFEYERPLQVGDRLTGTMVISEVFKKTGRRGGEMTFAVIETTFRDDRGSVALITRRTLIETADRPSSERLDEPVRKPRSLGPLDRIVVGDEAEPLVLGPLTRTDFVRYAGAAGDFNPNHHDELAAIRAGNERPFGMGMIPAGHLGRLLSEWIGAERIRRYRVRFVDRVWPGDILTATARVTDVPSPSGDGPVTCEGTVETQTGTRVLEATVEVEPNELSTNTGGKE